MISSLKSYAGVVQAGAVAVADEDVGAGPRLQHVGEILAAHRPAAVSASTALADDLGGDLGGKGGLLRRWLTGHRIAALVVEPAPWRRRRLRSPATIALHARLDQVAHAVVERADGAGELGGARR